MSDVDGLWQYSFSRQIMVELNTVSVKHCRVRLNEAILRGHCSTKLMVIMRMKSAW